MTIQALLVDLDGTYIDTEVELTERINPAALEVHGYKFDPSLRPLFTGLPDLEGIRVICTAHGITKVTPEQLREERRLQFLQWYSSPRHVPDAAEFYKGLSHDLGVRMAMVSSCDPEYFALADVALDIRTRFPDGVYLTKELEKELGRPISKPDPDPFLVAAQRIEIPIVECSVFEDSPLGIISGLRACGRVIAITRTLNEPDLLKTVRDHPMMRGFQRLEKGLVFIPDYSDRSYGKVIDYLR